MTSVPRYQHILFTTDLSQESRHAFAHALGLAVRYGAGLTILYVMEEVPQVKDQTFRDFLGPERWAEVRRDQEQEVRRLLIGKKREGSMIRSALQEMLADVRRDLGVEGSGTSDEVVVTHGDVVDAILQEVQTRGIDLMVMGYHARGRLEEAIAGSVSRSVLRKISIPVVLIKLP